jgi:putative GTP pyrophosphokinase
VRRGRSLAYAKLITTQIPTKPRMHPVTTGTKSAEEWGHAFSRVRGHHTAFMGELERLLKHILDEGGVEIAQLEARTKSVESFSDKIVRKNDKYPEPLSDITDLVGLRVTLYYPDDVGAVGELIEREFEVDWENSVRQGADSEPDRFGYRSDHYVVRLSDARRDLAEWKSFAKNRAEIQVRTVMQHAWAAVDHKIRYKGADLPRDLQRRLSRLSALLEVADEQFASLQRASDEAVNSYEQSVARGEFDVALDALSLRAYIDQTGIAQTWCNRAEKAGFVSPSSKTDVKRDSWGTSRTERLLNLLQEVDLSELKQFEQVLTRADDWGPEALAIITKETARAAKGMDESSGRVMAIAEDVFMMLAMIDTKRSDVVDATPYRNDIKAGIKAAIASLNL